MENNTIVIYESLGESISIIFNDLSTKVTYLELTKMLDITVTVKTDLYTLKREMDINVGNFMKFYNELCLLDEILVGKALLNNGMFDNDFILTISSDKRTGYFYYEFETIKYDFNHDNVGKDDITFKRSLDQTFLKQTINNLHQIIY